MHFAETFNRYEFVKWQYNSRNCGKYQIASEISLAVVAAAHCSQNCKNKKVNYRSSKAFKSKTFCNSNNACYKRWNKYFKSVLIYRFLRGINYFIAEQNSDNTRWNIGNQIHLLLQCHYYIRSWFSGQQFWHNRLIFGTDGIIFSKVLKYGFSVCYNEIFGRRKKYAFCNCGWYGSYTENSE